MKNWGCLIGLLGSASLVSPVRAQESADVDTLRAPTFFVSGGFEVGQAVGEFADYVEAGFGAGGDFIWRPNPRGPLAFRVSLGFLIYGSETRRYPLVPGITVDVTTNNGIFGFSLGPEIILGTGGLQFFAQAGLGGSYFATTSDVEGSDNNGSFASTTNYDDFTFAPNVGAGMLIGLSSGRVPIALELGARFVNNGRVTYVTKDRISVVGNELVVDPVASDANLIIYRLGVRIGLRGRSPDSQ